MLLLPLLWLVPAVIIGGERTGGRFLQADRRRAVGAWGAQSPPWFYLVRAQLTLNAVVLLTVVPL